MQSVIDIVVIVIGLFVIATLLQTLAKSQKAAEDTKPQYKYRLIVNMRSGVSPGRQVKTDSGNSLEYIQAQLNNFVFYSIESAVVYTNGVLTHKMDATGVLREV